MDSVGFRILSMYMNNQKLSQSDFLALFPDTRFRYIHDYKVNEEGKKITRQGTNVLDLSLNKEGFGTFFTVNGFPSTGKAEEANLVSLNASYVDFDIDPKKYPTQEDRDSIIQEAIMRGVEAGIPTPTVINRTWKGVHLIWLYPEKLSPTPENVAWWRNVQKRLVHFYNGDRNCTDPTRVLRVPYTLHLKNPKEPFEVYVQSYKPECRPTLDALDKSVPQYSEKEISASGLSMKEVLAGLRPGKGLRHKGIMMMASLLLKDAETLEDVEDARRKVYAWDKQKNGSTEPDRERHDEIDNVIAWVVRKKHESQSEKTQRHEALLNDISKDIPKESVLDALKPLLEELALDVEPAEAEMYIRHKVKDTLSLTVEDIKTIVGYFKPMRKRMLEEAEAERKSAMQVQPEESLSDEEIAEAEKILKSPTLLYDILQMAKKLGVVGEEKNVLLHYVVVTSRKLDRPLSVTVKGDSAAGKSFTLTIVLKLFPESAYIDLTEATPQSFFYTPEDHFKHRVIVIFEKHGSERADYAIRTLQSEGKLKIQVTVKNPVTGAFEAQTIEREGPTGFITTTTASVIHNENDTRNISMFPDQSQAQTERVYEAIEGRYTGVKKPGDDELKPWRDAQTLLKPLKVRIPFVEGFRKHFPRNIIRTRRDYGHFLAIIETSALLHQMQRQKIEIDGETYILATLADAHIAMVIVEESLSKSIYELPEKSIEVIKGARELSTELSDDPEATDPPTFNITALAKKLGWDRDTVSKWTKPATKKGYLTIVTESKGSKGAEYKLEEKELPTDAFLPSIAVLLADYPNESIEGIYDPLTGCLGFPQESTDAPTQADPTPKTTPRGEGNGSVGGVNGVGASVQADASRETSPDPSSFDF